ncbi:MAG TPA: hypothetical protein VFG87_14470, partial [Amycolatopsis sp.]|nr:hypothetical protein [Amycolatopsis sp.]
TAGEIDIQLAGVGADYWEAKGVDRPVGQLNILYVDDVDAQYERVSLAMGGTGEVTAPQDQPYGARVFTVLDLGGNSWTFWEHISDEAELPPGWQEIRADPFPPAASAPQATPESPTAAPSSSPSAT